MLSGEAADEFFGGYDRIYSWALKADSFQIDEVFKRGMPIAIQSIHLNIFSHFLMALST